MEKASESWGPSTQLPRKLVALTPVCSVPKLRARPENMRCLERSFSTIALHALSHLRGHRGVSLSANIFQLRVPFVTMQWGLLGLPGYILLLFQVK